MRCMLEFVARAYGCIAAGQPASLCVQPGQYTAMKGFARFLG